MSAGPSESADVPAPKVFISYRREETAAYAGRLYDAMVPQFGERNVFMDVDLEPGIDFVQRITAAVSACHVLIVVMGPRWATLEDEDGVRIAEPGDFVRLEVGTALRRSDVTVIPVLVSGARMPDPDDLPPDIAPITRRNALELSDTRWRYDVGRLTKTLDELLAEWRAPSRWTPRADGLRTGWSRQAPAQRPAPPRPAPPAAGWWRASSRWRRRGRWRRWGSWCWAATRAAVAAARRSSDRRASSSSPSMRPRASRSTCRRTGTRSRSRRI